MASAAGLEVVDQVEGEDRKCECCDDKVLNRYRLCRHHKRMDDQFKRHLSKALRDDGTLSDSELCYIRSLSTNFFLRKDVLLKLENETIPGGTSFKRKHTYIIPFVLAGLE